jgi:dolichol kinase
MAKRSSNNEVVETNDYPREGDPQTQNQGKLGEKENGVAPGLKTQKENEVIGVQLSSDNSNDLSKKAKKKKTKKPITATRSDLHLSRRFFHCGMGLFTAAVYGFLMDSQLQAVKLMGACAAIMYLLDQIRRSYPEFSDRIAPFNRWLLRAEEQLHESASIPYAMGMLLTIIIFPKPLAMMAILILGISDPLAGVVGIRFGKRKIMGGKKSLEGSAAYLFSSIVISAWVLSILTTAAAFPIIVCALFIGVTGSIFEMLPIRIDDNLTIPLFTATSAWVITSILGVVI